jgi:hypothetical protein
MRVLLACFFLHGVAASGEAMRSNDAGFERDIVHSRELWSKETGDWTYPPVPAVCQSPTTFMSDGPMAMLDRVLLPANYDK